MVFNLPAQSSSECRIIRQAIVDTAFAQVGNYEKTNRNDGKINKYALMNGGRYGDAYCSWGAMYCHKQNGVNPKVDGRAVSWTFPKASIIRKYGKVVKNVPVRQGDVAIFYFAPNYHVEIVTNYNTQTQEFYTVGFNTWGRFETGKRRQGVWIHKRNKRNVIICNQLQFFWYEKDKVHRIATILNRLHASRLPEN